ncbi:MAG: hypothetical protein IKE55_11305 [Kiritimatiellae bacterium]|nr:hypothetical protein [Kiritimatiellia bacterium]
MKLKPLLFIAAAAAGSAAFAHTWTGGAGDGLWTSSANWDGSGCPRAPYDEVVFNGSAAVSLDTGSTNDIAYIKVIAGDVVLTATEGSALRINQPGYNNPSGVTGDRGIIVSKGASLDISAPLAEMSGRFDRQGEGTLVIRDIAVRKTNSTNMYFFNGTNSFVGTASLTLPTATATFGVGSPFGPMPVFIRDQAQLNVAGISTSASSDGAPYVDIVQDGEDTSVAVASGIELICSKKNNVPNPDVQRYTLKSGTLSAQRLVLQSANPTNVQYVQEGGTSTFSSAVSLYSGSAALRGGTMNFTGANNDFNMGVGTTFGISGGTLAWPRGFNPSGWPQFRYSGRFGVTVPSGSSLEWDWSRADVAPGTVFVQDGAGTLKFVRAVSTYGVGLEVAAGKTVLVDSWCTVSAPRGSTEPWKVTINDGAVLRMQGGTARISTPLDLTANGTGKVFFDSCRGAVVAHRLTVDGVEKAKGRYYFALGHSNSFVGGTSGWNGSSVIVPHVWTGAGGDNLWSNAENWDGGVVPNGQTVCADISRATTITLNEDIALSCLVAMPNGAERKVTVTGSGSISVDDSNQIGYDCALLVPQDCELVLDVDLKRAVSNTMALQGGGRLTVKKEYPGCTSGVQPLLAIDGEVSFAGTTVVKGTGYNFLSGWTYEGGESHFFVEDGATVTAARLQVTKAGYIMPDDFRQRGGTTTFDAFYLGNYNVNSTQRGTLVYYLDGGSMTVNGAINLGRCLGSSDSPRYPGGSFEMSGGTLACTGISGGLNQNFVRLYGGDLYLKGNLTASLDTPAKIAVTNRNETTYYLGGVTIHPQGATRSMSSGNVWLTGRNGDCTIDASEQTFSFSAGNTVAGPGGIVVTGSNSSKGVEFSTPCTFEGAITIRGGKFSCWSNSAMNGPRELVVENASSTATFGCPFLKSLDRVVLQEDDDLFLAAGLTLTTKRMVVGGADLPAGTYSARFGNGDVVVTGPSSSWVVDGAGDLSWFADGTTTTVDAATALSSLVYSPNTSGETNALAGAALTFEDGANIYVAKGDTLVIGNDVVLGGKVTKTGEGEVVFNGGVTAPVAATDGYWLTVEEGGATFDGAVTGVRLVTCGTKTLPVITLNEHCTVTDYAIVLTAYSYGNAVANAMGETRQNGATVDYSAGVFETVRAACTAASDLYPLSRPNGGSGRYVLNSGTFSTGSSYKPTFFEKSGDLGTFEFVQNGGTFIVRKSLFFSRELKNGVIDISYTINDGRVEFYEDLSGTLRKYNFINFNGGTVVFRMSSGSNFALRQFFTVSVGGDVTFELGNSANSVRFPNDITGDGTITFSGGNYYFSGELNVGGLDIAAGTVALGDCTALAATGGTALSIARNGAELSLGYDGQMPVATLSVGGAEQWAGVYSATRGSTSAKRVLRGCGELVVLSGVGPGMTILVR